MTIVEHLEELRTRLIVSSIAVIIATVISLLFTTSLFEALKAPLPPGVRIIYTAPMELFGTYLKVALYAGIVLSMPMLLYQFTAFISPAMTKREKRFFFMMLPGILLFFAGGIVFGYKLVLPNALPYLLGLFPSIAEPFLRIGDYISFVVNFLLALGLSFQTPMVIFVLAKLKVVTPKRLTGMRKYALVLAFVVSAVITPTPDPINQSMVAIPIYLLFEIGILLARLA